MNLNGLRKTETRVRIITAYVCGVVAKIAVLFFSSIEWCC